MANCPDCDNEMNLYYDEDDKRENWCCSVCTCVFDPDLKKL